MTSRLTRLGISLCCALLLFSKTAGAVPLIRDAEVEHTLRSFSDPVFKTAGLKPSAVKIFIVNDNSLNAFVAGGSNLFLHTGMILSTETPDMLIGVIAHETGHIAGGHLARGGEKLKDAQLGAILSAILGAAAGAATGTPEAAAAVITGGQNTLMRNILAYTRVQEEAADQAALSYLDALNISADGMMKTFALLQRQERLHSSRPDPYMRSHPLSSQRVDLVRNHVERSGIPAGTYPKSYDEMHKRMVAKLFGFLNSPERTLQKYPLTDKSFAARMARSVAYYKMTDTARALEEIDSMINERPSDPYLYDLKGQVQFENNRVEDALASYRQASKLAPGSALILTDLAKVELAQAKPNLPSAISNLEKAASMDNSNSYLWRLLATAYGKSGNMGMSYLALAEEALLQNKPEDAIRQADLALQLLKPKTPSSQRAQDVKLAAQGMKKE